MKTSFVSVTAIIKISQTLEQLNLYFETSFYTAKLTYFKSF